MVDVAGPDLTSEEAAFLTSPAVGGVILFSRNYQNPEQVSALIGEIKSLRSPALLIAVDQEGGRVQRFKEGFTRLPPMERYGQLYDPQPDLALDLCRCAGQLMAAELLATGIDFSFAPVLDCAKRGSKAIGDRAFHYDPDAITVLAGAFIDGMNAAGMVATGKHFPGHGGVIADSHFRLPVDRRSMAILEKKDLLPFRRLAGRLGGILTAHVSFTKIDPQCPTFSSFWLQEVLRHDMGFKGIIFSDDLSMKAAHNGGDVVERTRRALRAGCDMGLICNDHEKAARAVSSLGESIRADQGRLLSMRGAPGDGVRPEVVGKLREFIARHQ